MKHNGKKEGAKNKTEKPRPLKAFFRIIGGIALTLCLTAVICASALFIYCKSYYDTVNPDAFAALARTQDRTTKIYYLSHSDNGNGDVATEIPDQALYSAQNREWLPSEQIPQMLKDAFISIEDHRFYSHNGIDIRRTLGAVLGYLKGGRSYGGSTLTQQLIKNVTGNDDYSVSRKLHEIIFALKLDGALTKDEILELYLNTIYLSDRCYGIESAAEYYFGREAPSLSLTECAALACIPQSPAKWNPRTNPKNNASRRATVLKRMSELGYITDEEYEQASQLSLNVTATHKTGEQSDGGRRYSWYTEAVIDDAIQLLLQHRIAPTKEIATKLLYSGGLSIITAQNPEMQRIAEEYFADSRNFQAVDGSLIQPECSTVVIDPKTGNILALVGGRGEKTGNRILNFATKTARSPGSSIKPLSVYAPALEKKTITYGSVFDDTPYKFIKTGNGNLRPWPQNSPRGYRGLTTVRDAVSRSVNTVAVKVLNTVGKEEVFSLLHDRLGISGLVQSRDIGGKLYTDIADSPLAHGQLTKGVSVRDITGAYTAICDGGVFHPAKTVLKILDGDGKLLIDNTVNQGERIFSAETATITTKLLQGVTGGGTAASVKLKKKIECAGKTGTTNADCDRWFIGYTPDLLCGVWFGYATPKSLSGFSRSPNPPIKAWDELMEKLENESVLGHAPTKKFPQNPNVVTATYCRDSGKLVTAACLADPRGSRVETGYFTKDTVPKAYCDCHVLVKYDFVNHGVAGSDCPSENCRSVGLITVDRSFPTDVTVADAQYVYRSLRGSPPCLLSNEPFFLTAQPRGSSPGHSKTQSPFNRFCYHCYFAARQKPEYSDYEDAPPAEESAKRGQSSVSPPASQYFEDTAENATVFGTHPVRRKRRR